jgi:hypothetical protein
MVPELACNKSCPGQSQGMDGVEELVRRVPLSAKRAHGERRLLGQPAAVG